MAMECKPVGWTVLVEEFKRDNLTDLILPDSVKELALVKHVVIAIGDDRITADGRTVPIPVKVGDEVRWNADNPQRVCRLDPQLFDNRQLAIVDCDCIKGVFSGEPDRKKARRILAADGREAALVH